MLTMPMPEITGESVVIAVFFITLSFLCFICWIDGYRVGKGER